MTLKQLFDLMQVNKAFIAWSTAIVVAMTLIYTLTTGGGVEGRFALLVVRQAPVPYTQNSFDFDADTFFALRAAEATAKTAAEFLKDPVFRAGLAPHQLLTPRVFAPQYLKVFFRTGDEAAAVALRDSAVTALNERLKQLVAGEEVAPFIVRHADFEIAPYRPPILANLILAIFVGLTGSIGLLIFRNSKIQNTSTK